MGSREEFDNIEGLDEAFLKEIDTLAARADLANIPTNFYTPRVQSANNEHNEAGWFVSPPHPRALALQDSVAEE